MREYLEYLYLNKKDYTLGFRRLSDALLADSKTGSANGPVCGGLEIQNLPWFGKWKNRIFNQGLNALEICKSLDQVNPAVIARNHKVVGVIEYILETGDWSRLPDVGEILRNPFVETDQNKDWIEPASEDQKVTTTHCNT